MKRPLAKIFGNKSFSIYFLCLVLFCLSACKDKGNTPLDKYNVIWESPGDTEQNAMPLGNGDIGLNVWVEQGGDLLFYVGKTDSWDENARLLNLGRVRVKISPNPFGKGLAFQQELKLRQGKMVITAGPQDSQVLINFWVDANQPVARIEVSGEEDFDIQASLETWRNEEHELQHLTHSDIYDHYLEPPSPFKMIVKPDVVIPGGTDRITWYHDNGESDAFYNTMKLQAMEGFMDRLCRLWKVLWTGWKIPFRGGYPVEP